MNAVADSTPLIHLSAASLLPLLPELFQNVLIPPKVFEEVVIQGHGRPGSEEVESAIGVWMEVRRPQHLVTTPGEFDIGSGEREAISLAIEAKPSALLIDDRGPVVLARSLGIQVLTTPLILIAAQRAGLIDSVKRHLDILRSNGFWLQDSVYWDLLRACDEE